MFNSTTLRSNNTSSRQHAHMRHYLIVPNRWSDTRFTIYENSKPKYYIRGGAPFRGVDTMRLEDKFGTPLITIEKDWRIFTASIYRLLSNDGRELANIKKPFSILRSEINTINGPYRLHSLLSPSSGVYVLFNAKFENIARIVDGMVAIAGNQHQELVLVMIIVINHLKPSPPPPVGSGGGFGGGGH